jgi:hypothetical protein
VDTPRVPRALAPLLVVAAGLTGCLGYGDPNVVADVIQQTYTKRNAADCTDRETRRYVEQNALTEGNTAQVLCRTVELKVEPARSVDVSGVRVRGDSATAHVVMHGGAQDGRRETVQLVKEPNGWKLDRIVALHLTRRAVETQVRQLLADAPGMSPRQQACEKRVYRRIPLAELERAIVKADGRALFEKTGVCFRTPRSSAGA